METLRSRLVLVFSIPPVPLTDWLPTLSPGLLRDNWLVLTPWLPEPMPFEPRWVADPGCCCCACWFTLGIWDRLSPVTCLPWLASLLSGCIWKAGDWGEGLVRRTAGLLVSGVTLLTGDTDGEKKKKKSVISILEAGSGLSVWTKLKPCSLTSSHLDTQLTHRHAGFQDASLTTHRPRGQ